MTIKRFMIGYAVVFVLSIACLGYMEREYVASGGQGDRVGNATVAAYIKLRNQLEKHIKRE